MKKILLSLFILLDLAVIGACSVYLFYVFTESKKSTAYPRERASSRSVRLPPESAASSSSSEKNASPLFPPVPSHSVVSSARRILFAYRNAKAKKVLIRGDFTGWKGEPMQKTAP